MKIVIDISEKDYKFLKKTYKETGLSFVPNELRYAFTKGVYHGTPLPKGHGRLIDADKVIAMAWTNFYKHEDEWEKKDKDYLPFGRMYDQNGFECCQQTIVNAPTIIEADKEGEKNDKI